MSPQGLIDKYYPEANELRHILLTHSRSVADKALWIADRHPELSLDRDFLYEAAMLHDIGIFLTDADGIYCFGDKPDMLPVSMEEQVVCFADKFYSKTHLDREKSVEKARDSLLRYGKAGVQRFDYWCKLFL